MKQQYFHTKKYLFIAIFFYVLSFYRYIACKNCLSDETLIVVIMFLTYNIKEFFRYFPSMGEFLVFLRFSSFYKDFLIFTTIFLFLQRF
jgi:hypothetical protein